MGGGCLTRDGAFWLHALEFETPLLKWVINRAPFNSCLFNAQAIFVVLKIGPMYLDQN
jgi:hypothetical protein